MDKQELKNLVAQLLREMDDAPESGPHPADASAEPLPDLGRWICGRPISSKIPPTARPFCG